MNFLKKRKSLLEYNQFGKNDKIEWTSSMIKNNTRDSSLL